MPKKKRNVTPEQAMTALRPMGRNKDADAILIVRGWLNSKGEWHTEWEGGHWMHDLRDEMLSPSGLPLGFGVASAKELASLTAGDTAEESLGRFGAALGKGLVSAIGEKIGGLSGDNQ